MPDKSNKSKPKLRTVTAVLLELTAEEIANLFISAEAALTEQRFADAQGDYDRLRKHYETTEAWQDYVTYRIKVIEVALHKDRPEKDYNAAAKAYNALSVYCRANNNLKDYESYRNLAIKASLLAEERRYPDAVDSYKNLGQFFRNIDPKKYEYYTILAAATVLHLSHPTEERQYTRAVELYNYLGKYFKEENSEKYEYYTKLTAETAIHPDCPEAKRDYGNAVGIFSSLVRVLKESDSVKATEAINSFTAFVDSYKHPPKGYSLLGNFYRRIGYFDKALEYIEAAEKLNPNAPRDTYHRGLVYQDQGNYRAAKEAFQNAVILDPEYQEYQWALSEVETTLTIIEKWREQQQGTSDEEKIAIATQSLKDNQTALLEKLDTIVAAYNHDNTIINRGVFRPYRDGVEALRSDAQTGKLSPFSLEGFVAGQVSSPRNIVNLLRQYYDGKVSSDAFATNNHPFTEGKDATTVTTLMLAELAPLILNHTIIREQERLEEYREQPEEVALPLPVSTHSLHPSLIPLDAVMEILNEQEPTIEAMMKYFEEQSGRS